MPFHVRHAVREYLMGVMVLAQQDNADEGDDGEPMNGFHSAVRRTRRHNMIEQLRKGNRVR